MLNLDSNKETQKYSKIIKNSSNFFCLLDIYKKIHSISELNITQIKNKTFLFFTVDRYEIVLTVI